MPAKILITGGTGFIGSEITRHALAAGHQVATVVRDPEKLPQDSRLISIRGDLSRLDWRAIENFCPTICLHCAWIATPGVYQTSPANADYRDWSIRLAERLYGNGLEKFIGLGTCLEYASSSQALDENSLRPAKPSPYTLAKLAVLDALKAMAPSPQAWAWMRVFYAYGSGEHPQRFLSSAIRELSQGKSLILRRPDDVVDYIHVKDIASATFAAMDPAASGIFNVGSGRGQTVAEVARIAASMCGAEGQLEFDHPADAESRFASIRRLQNYKWKPQYAFENGLEEIVASVRGSLHHSQSSQ